MSTNDNLMRDGLLSSMGGVDSGRSPLLLQADQLQWAENIVCRGGHPETRPPFYKRTLSFATAEQQSWFENNRLQGAAVYQTRSGLSWHIVAIAGRLFTVDAKTYAVREITPVATTTMSTGFTAPAIGNEAAVVMADAERMLYGYPVLLDGAYYLVTDKNGNTVSLQNLTDVPGTVRASGITVVYLTPASTKPPMAYFQQAQEYMVIQDNHSRARIYNGSTCRWSITASGEPEVPAGGPMAYSNGRLWVAVGGDEVAAGDIVGGDTNVINFTEENILNGGGRFRVGGEITAMVETAIMDTSLGQGPLQVFTKDGAYSINVPINRELWQNLSYPIQTVSLKNGGAMGHYGTTLVNSDIFYRSQDGLRSMRMAAQDFQSWGNTPISSELERVTHKDYSPLLYRTSVIFFDNRALMTVGPMWSSNGVYFRWICSLDFRPIQNMREKAPPAYDGAWTGEYRPTLLVTESFSGKDRAFAWSLDDNDKNVLVELMKTGELDDGTTQITGSIETKAFTFGKPLDLKKLEFAEMYIDRLNGVTTFDLDYRPDQYPCWINFGTHEARNCGWPCEPSECQAWTNPMLGHFVRLGFANPSNTDTEPHNIRPTKTGYDFQLKLSWTGKARLLKLVLKALNQQEASFPPTGPITECRYNTCCP